MKGPYAFGIIFSVFVIFCSSCASHNPKYKFGLKHKKVQAPSQNSILHELYLIGDAGNAPQGQSTPLLKHLKKQFDHASKETTVLWLGDNIYPVGLAPIDDNNYALGIHRINKQLETLENYQGNVYFIPGNHDWYEFGQEGIIRQENHIEAQLRSQKMNSFRQQENYFLPDQGCGDPIFREINENIGLIIADSQWYLKDHQDSSVEHCLVKNRKDFRNKLRRLYSTHQDKIIITAIHHPLHTYGKHGGRNTISDHVFPLRKINKHLWFPLPILGSVLIYGRTKSTYQDANHIENIEYKKFFLNAMKNVRKNIVVSGHEHSIQMIERDDNYFIVSGAGSKREPVGMGKGSLFSAGEMGYVKLSFLAGDLAFAECFVQDIKTKEVSILFQYYMNMKH